MKLRICLWLFCSLSAALHAATNPPVSPSWSQEITHPASWLSWGFDFRFRNEYYDNAATLNGKAPDHEFNYQRYRPRLWTLLEPLPNLQLDARLVWEGRSYIKPLSKDAMDWDEALLDHLCLRLTNLFDQPLALTVGRQDFTFGNKWIIWDGTTTDASRSEFFDAARLTWNWVDKKTTVDAIYVDQAADSERWLHPINSRNKPLTEQDERAGILYISNHSLKKTRLDGYFIYKHDHKVLAKGNQGHTYVFGARVDGELDQHWKYRAEFAPQLGDKNGRDLFGFGWNSRLSYFTKDSWNNNFRLGYEYLSGDDPNTPETEAWDPLWGRRAQWSELLAFTVPGESRGRSAEWTNLQRLDAGWSCNPVKKLECLADYMPLWANENPLRGTAGYNPDGTFRGHLIAGVLKYTFNDHWAGHLWSEFFLPGDYYAAGHRDAATFYRVEMMFKF